MLRALRGLFKRGEPDSPAETTARRPKAPEPPATPAERAVFHRSDFISRGREIEVFALGPDGMPTGHLAAQKDRLVIVPDDAAPGEAVNPKSTRAHSLGIYSFSIAGTSYHDAAVRRGDFRPVRPVRLEREPRNEHDPNAVAVYAEGAKSKAGYVNRQNAARLARLIDAGEDIAAISIRGAGPGADGAVPVILAARREVLRHLMRTL